MKRFSVTIRFKNLDNHKQSIYLDIYDGKHNKRKRQFLGYRIYKNPETRLQRQENRLYLEAAEIARLEILSARIVPVETPFYWYYDKQNKGTDIAYDVIRKHLKQFLPETILISEITREPLEDFIRLLNDKYTGGTPWLYWTKLRHIFNSAIKDEIIRSNPCDKVNNAPKRMQTAVDFLSIAEMRKLDKTKCIDPDFKAAFLFCCFTGFRMFSEALKITWDDIEIKDGVYYCTYTMAKTRGRKRTVILNKQAVIFLGDPGKGLCFQPFFHGVSLSSRVLPKWLHDAGIKKRITTKAARHTFATHLQSLSGDIYLVQKALGHTELKTTVVYAKIESERLKKVKDSYSL